MTTFLMIMLGCKVRQQKPSRMVSFCWTKPRTLQAGSTVHEYHLIRKLRHFFSNLSGLSEVPPFVGDISRLEEGEHSGDVLQHVVAHLLVGFVVALHSNIHIGRICSPPWMSILT